MKIRNLTWQTLARIVTLADNRLHAVTYNIGMYNISASVWGDLLTTSENTNVFDLIFLSRTLIEKL